MYLKLLNKYIHRFQSNFLKLSHENDFRELKLSVLSQKRYCLPVSGQNLKKGIL